MSSTQPRTITKSDPTKISLTWGDGHETVYTAAELRRICPCARCVNEFTGALMLDPVSIPDSMTHENLRLVGNYAITLKYADGHDTGIYPFAMLREQDPSGA
jgi:DUF971 family protein